MKQEWIVYVWCPYLAKEVRMRDVERLQPASRMVHPNIHIQCPHSPITQEEWTKHLQLYQILP